MKTSTTIKKKQANKKKLNGYHYKIQSEGERKEVEWLIEQGDFDSIEDYEEFWTKVRTGKKKPVNLQ